MGIYTVARTGQISELEPITVKVEKIWISIYNFKGKYFAYENICAHEGGPVSEGRTLGELECKVSSEGKVLEEHFSKSKINIVCPWHGVTYDVETGICRADSRLRLTRYEVIVENDDIKVKIPTTRS